MNAPTATNSPAIGQPFEGGFYAGSFQLAGILYAIVVAPKAEGEHEDAPWIRNYAAVPGARSYDDGLANTDAMVAASSLLAKWARDLRINDRDDWYLPSQDELEILYRNLKPGTEQNTCYARSGINLSVIPPTRPYIPEFPLQTSALAFQAGGEQAFGTRWYWSSTQHAALSDYAWCQNFYAGSQYGGSTNSKFRARAVRRIPIE